MSMIERVAKRLANETDADWEAMPIIHKLVFRAHARAAMEAMRITDYSTSCPDDMIDAGRNAFMEWGVDHDDHKRANAATVDCWNAMLSVALHGDQEG